MGGKHLPGRDGVLQLDEAIRKAIERTTAEWSLTCVEIVGVLEEVKLDVWHQDYHKHAKEPENG